MNQYQELKNKIDQEYHEKMKALRLLFGEHPKPESNGHQDAVKLRETKAFISKFVKKYGENNTGTGGAVYDAIRHMNGAFRVLDIQKYVRKNYTNFHRKSTKYTTIHPYIRRAVEEGFIEKVSIGLYKVK